jgi:hypothetical protein
MPLRRARSLARAHQTRRCRNLFGGTTKEFVLALALRCGGKPIIMLKRLAEKPEAFYDMTLSCVE